MIGGILGFNYDYEESARGRLLVVGADEIAADSLGEAGVRMLTEHEIPGILPLEVEYTNFRAKLSYSVKGRKPLAEVVKGRKLSFTEYVKIIRQVIAVINESPRYFLNESNFVLSLDYIFSTNDYELGLVYLPVNGLQSKDNILNELRNNIIMVLYAQINDRDTVAAKPILEDFLNADYSLVEIGERLDKRAPIKPPDQPNPVRQQGFSPESSPSSNHPNTQPPHPSIGAKEKSPKPDSTRGEKASGKQGSSSLSGPLKIAIIAGSSVMVALAWFAFVFLGKGNQQEGYMYIAIGVTLLGADSIFATLKFSKRIQTTDVKAQITSAKEQGAAANEGKNVAGGRTPASSPRVNPFPDGTVPLSNPTVLLSQAHLDVENEEQKKIMLSNLPLILGRGKTYGTYTLSDQAVSGRHASFDNIDGQYVVTDLSSTNGTRLNGTKLIVDKPYPICDGDIIQMGRINFTFRLEI